MPQGETDSGGLRRRDGLICSIVMTGWRRHRVGVERSFWCILVSRGGVSLRGRWGA